MGQENGQVVMKKQASLMELLGIQFAPLRVPLQRRLQTLAALCWIVWCVIGGPCCAFLTLYLIIYSQLRYILIVYLLWCYIDRDTCNKGGRRSNWVRNWAWWTYFRDYFPLKLVKTVDLDPNETYLFCVYPHGVLSSGAFASFSTDCMGFHELFPGITPYPLTLEQHFLMPFFREFGLGLGGCAATSKSIRHLLGSPEPGKAVVLIVGGASESLKCKPKTYKIILKRRRGFIRLAMQTGRPLVPVISFGETDLYDQVNNPEGSWVFWCQRMFQRITGIAPVLLIGRGIFQYTFGIIPRRRPVHTVVGKPMKVKKIANPTNEQISDVHAEFTDHLIQFFEEHKSTYIANADNVHLEIIE